MGPSQQPPQPAQSPILVQTGTAGAIAAGDQLVGRIAGFSPAQAQTVMLMVLAVVVCAAMFVQMYVGQKSDAEKLALLLRSQEASEERNRAALAAEFQRNAAEFQRNRDVFSAEAKANRDSATEMTKVVISSYAKLGQDLGKFEAAVTTLSASIGELKRKLPNSDVDICPLPEVMILRGALKQ